MFINRGKYYYTGLFVSVAIVLLVLLLIFSGFFTRFHKTLYLETYFQGSVEGLAVGAPVKFHDVTVGQVSKIEFIGNVYPRKNSTQVNKQFALIYVLASINADNIPNTTNQRQFDAAIKRLVSQGLRATISTYGLTGASFVSMDFLPVDEQTPPLGIYWAPKYAYVPASKSSLEYLSDSVRSVSRAIENINFPKLGRQINETVDHLSQTSENLNSFIDEVIMNPSMLIFTKQPQPIYHGGQHNGQ